MDALLGITGVIIFNIALLIWIYLTKMPINLKAMESYWKRPCAGRQWRRRFPQTTKQEIREFIDTLLEAFYLDSNKRLKFRPDGKVMGIYQTLYPPNEICADDMELEYFATELEHRYGLQLKDLNKAWHEEITLGELFVLVRG